VAFHGKTKQKLWVWIALDRVDQEVIAFAVGDRTKKTFRKLIRLLEKQSITQIATDGWKVYKELSAKKHVAAQNAHSWSSYLWAYYFTRDCILYCFSNPEKGSLKVHWATLVLRTPPHIHRNKGIDKHNNKEDKNE